MKRLVIAEDDSHIAVLVEFCLEDLGFEVEHYDTGLAAWERLEEGPAPDICILDLQMPGMTGLEILTKLKADPVRAEIPVLILSARAKDADRARAIEFGAAAYLTKPFDTTELSTTVASLVGLPEAWIGRVPFAGLVPGKTRPSSKIAAALGRLRSDGGADQQHDHHDADRRLHDEAEQPGRERPRSRCGSLPRCRDLRPTWPVRRRRTLR